LLRAIRGLLVLGLAASLGCGARSAISLAGGSGGSPVTSTSTFITSTASVTGTAAISSSSTMSGCQDATLALNPIGAGYLALDGADVYWTTGDGKVVKSTSGAPGVVLAEGFTDVAGLAVRGDDVFFADETRVLSVPKAGGAVTVVATMQSLPTAIVTDAGAIYWLNYGEGILAGSLVESVGGGPPEVVMDSIGTPSDLAIDGDGNLYFAAAIAVVDGMPVSGPLVRVSPATGAATVLAIGVQEPAGIAVDAANVYWLETVSFQGGFPGRLRTLPKTGGTPKDLASTQDVLAIRLSVDDAFAYMTGMEGTGPTGRGVLWRVPLGGGTFTEVDHTLETLYGALANDATSLYFTIGWADQTMIPPDAPSVRRLCK
jgi:hypothetical protein